MTRKIVLVLLALILWVPAIAYSAEGQPFQALQQQIDDLKQQFQNIQLTPGPQGPAGPEGPAGPTGATGPAAPPPPNGTQVGPNLYHVHTRVLWDLGWLTDSSYLSGGLFTYWEDPRPLVYGSDITLFLSPLKGYGIPEVPENATRKVRLYVNYGHQWMCGGTPTVKITNGSNEVEFSLPIISGLYRDMGANWSDFKEFSEYENIGHAQIQVYQKDFYYDGSHCGPYPGTGPSRPKGVVYRIEAHFYDEYPAP
jgi:hypothetical protein